jgi:GNAT superfamily N-acetyltransferase
MAAAHPSKKQSLARLRGYGLSPQILIRNKESGILSEPEFLVREIADGYIVIFAEEEPPIAEVKDYESHNDDPSDYFGGLEAEIISLEEKKVVGTCECRVYYFEEMAGLFTPGFILSRLDDECADKADAGLEIQRRKRLRHLLTWDADTNLLHAQRLRIAKAHRGKDLGLKTLSVLIDYAANALNCGYAIMKPCPLEFEPGDAGHDTNTRAFSQARKKLFDYYQKLGFTRPSPRSEYLYKEIQDLN